MTRRNPHGIVIVGGDVYDTWEDKQVIKQISVELVTDQSCEATFTVFDDDFKFLDRYSSSEGMPQIPVLFYLGFGQDLGPPVFKGLLARSERGSTDSTLIVYDMGYKMRQEQKAEYHRKLDDIEIITKLAKRNGLKVEGPDKAPDPPLDKHPSMIQDSKNDWEHSYERAQKAGYNIFVRQDTLFIKDPAKLSTPILTLKFRKDFILLHNFSLTYKLPENERGSPKIVEHRGRRRGGRRLTGKSKERDRGTKSMEMRDDLDEHTPTWVKRRAHAHHELHREPAWNCSIRSIPPLPGLRPDVRNTIELQNVGRLFSNLYICDKVRHELTANSFFTDYTLVRDKQ